MQSSAGNHADVFVRSSQMRLVVSSVFVFVDLRRDESQEILYVFFEAGVGLILAAADAKGMRGQARAAVLFENLENLFPVAEGVEQRRHGADIERVRAQPKLVAGDAVQFGQDHADILARGGASTFSSFSTASQ
jgi:phage-related tail fiber protein